ncbi:MAG: ATP-binding cassette domain-containing protein [Planctomycetes bacterium]|nr:ATP-binding cassette domain-containing protein [Planctomycetota bacterium]
MPLLSVVNLGHAHGTQVVLSDVTFSIEPGEHIGLVGRNGTGKTTLLRALAGMLQYDSGEIQIGKSKRVGYLSQDPNFDPELTVFEVAEQAYADLFEAHRKLNQVAAGMETAQGDALDKLLSQYTRLEREVEHLGGYQVRHRIEETLHGLGFVDAQFEQNVQGLSGGESSRLALARLLLEDPDLLLLDEPTNHLDIDGRRWLETFLAEEFRGAVLLVSHDRYLLDRVVHRIIEIEPGGRMYSYPGNYEAFRTLRLERKHVEQRVYEKQLDHVRAEKKFIARYKTGQRAKQARGRESKLDRFKDAMIDRPVELDVMHLQLPKTKRSGDIVMSAEGVSKQYDERTLFSGITMTVSRGERVGVIGPNGSGKTTLVSCLIGTNDCTAGITSTGANVTVGHFRQSDEGLDPDHTVWQYLQRVIPAPAGMQRAPEQQARDLAGAFLFSGDDQDKRMGQLSGGERRRAVLAGVVAGGYNLLILDEPTNHFDLPSCERLEIALDPDTGYDGTLILISHDRALLDACVDRLIILDGNGRVETFHGNYSEWFEWTTKRRREHLALEAEQKQRAQAAAKPRQEALRRQTEAKKSASVTGAHTKMSLGKLEQAIEKIEARIKAVDEQLIDPATHRDGLKVKALTDERTSLAEQLGPLELEWARRADDD